MSCSCTAPSPRLVAGFTPIPAPRLSAARRLLATWRRRARERAELAAMTPVQLRDIRISDGEARATSRRPFWRG